MIIRTGKSADAREISTFWEPLIRETTITFTNQVKTPEMVEDMIAKRGEAFIVAENGGVVVGFATFDVFRNGPGYARTSELSIILLDIARGKGIGRALIAELEERARKAGIHVLVAGISADNATALAFHAAVGFKEVGRMNEVGRKFDRWLDLVLMQKLLESR